MPMLVPMIMRITLPTIIISVTIVTSVTTLLFITIVTVVTVESYRGPLGILRNPRSSPLAHFSSNMHEVFSNFES